MKTIKELAEIHGCEPRTVRRWKQQGAPLGDASAMRRWLAGRKHTPRGAVAAIPGTGSEPSAHDTRTGAASALRRLETAEAAAFNDLQAAISEGDALAVKLAREGWLKIGDSLRKHDLALEQSRRDAGELLPRATVEEMLRWLGYGVFFASQQVANATAPMLEGQPAPKLARELHLAMTEALAASIAAVKRGWADTVPLPDWPLAAVVTGAQGGTYLPDRVKVFESLISSALNYTHPVPVEKVET